MRKRISLNDFEKVLEAKKSNRGKVRMKRGNKERKKAHALKRVALGILMAIAGTLLLGFLANDFSKDRSVKPLHLESVSLNGSRQWISLSQLELKEGQPVLLFLHGGPGSANLSLFSQLTPQLDDHALLVNWDQRNCGKSFHLFQSRKKLSLEQNLLDAHALTQYLKDKFEVDRITLMGFSAGTVLGIKLIDRFPEDYDLFISVAQMVDGQRGEILSLEHALEQAKENGDATAVRQLSTIQFDFSRPEEILQNTQAQRKHLLQYGGVYHRYDSYGHEAQSLWRSREYDFLDFVFWPYASSMALQAMWHEIVMFPVDEKIPEVDVPVVFLSGKYDMNNPTKLTRAYFETLIAPKGKEFILFEHSAHAIFWDEPEAFESEVIRVLQRHVG